MEDKSLHSISFEEKEIHYMNINDLFKNYKTSKRAFQNEWLKFNIFLGIGIGLKRFMGLLPFLIFILLILFYANFTSS